MTEQELKAWAEGQIKALVEIGVDGLEAQNTVKRVLAQLPEGADPNTWIPGVETEEIEITESDIDDARADWWASDAVPSKFKRLLDATEQGDEVNG